MSWWATKDLKNIIYKSSSPFPANAKGEKCFICDKKFTQNGIPRNLIWNYSPSVEFGLQGSSSNKKGQAAYTAVPIHVFHSDNDIKASLCKKVGVNDDSGLYKLGGMALLNEAEDLYNNGKISHHRHSQICLMSIIESKR